MGAIFDLGLQMPDEMLRSVATLGEAFEWTLQRRTLDIERQGVASPIETLFVKLRTLRPEDAAILYPGSINPEHSYRWRYRGSTPSPAQFSQDLFDGSTFVQFVVESKENNRPLGLVQAYNVRLDAGTCYFAFTRTSADNVPVGELTAGLYLFISYLFRTFPFRKVYAEIPGFNWDQFSSGEGSLFEVEGSLRAYDYYDGRYWDMRIIAIDRESWAEIQAEWDPVLH